MNRFTVIVATILLFSVTGLAQEQLGMRTSNYAGVNGLTLNPAGSLVYPFRWDVNLIEFGQFFDNNYFFVENFRLLDALNLPSKGALRPDLTERNLPTPPDRFVVDFYRSRPDDDKFTFRGDLVTNVMGPSLLLQLGDATVVGLYTRARGVFNARKLPGAIGYYEFTDKEVDSLFVVQPFKVGGMAWSEIGLNYARTGVTEYGDISFGGTIKWLQGYEAGYGSMEQSMTFRQLPGNRLIGEPGRTKHAFTIPSVTENDVQLQRKGSGVAIDLGMAFTILDENDHYKWKIGFSLLDVGAIRFNKSAENHAINVTDSTALYFKEFEQFESADQLDSVARLFSRQTMKDPYASLQGRAFTMWLPTAFSVQAEMAVLPSFFVNATWIQGLPLAKNTIRRNNLLGITPRFERRWFEAALPITMLDWKHLRSGLAVRLGFLWLGTEDLGSVIRRSNFDSTDFYFALKVNPFQLNLGNKSDKNKQGYQGYQGGNNRSNVRAKSKRDIKCPKF
ncbi:MAG: DUF5723 family protein [Saprospiraceae bacterium]